MNRKAFAPSPRGGFRQKKGPKPATKHDSRWNLDKEKGREVSIGDVMIYARQFHRPCRGKGKIGETTPCQCAAVRWFTKCKDRIIMDEDGLSWWIKGMEPNAPPVVDCVMIDCAIPGPHDHGVETGEPAKDA